MSKTTVISWILVAALSTFVCACSSPQVKVNLSSTANLNMNRGKEPLPVVVRIYQLTDPRIFENATFSELWKNDLSVLGNTLLRKDSLTLDPASRQRLQLDRHEQTRYIALMAAFNSQPGNSWRVVKEANGSILGIEFSTNVKALLKDNVIELMP